MPQTIVALATAAGRSGIGVVRLSGNDACSVTENLTGRGSLNLEPRRVTLLDIVDPADKTVIDKALITYFKAPHSFTGEDVIELSCHGSPVLLRQVIDLCLASGCRLAEPGEFTLRALANGRMDLSEAEAIRDLIDARTTASARQAVRQMRGEFSNRLKPIKDRLLDTIVILESALEFVEDDLPETQTARLREQLTEVANDVGEMAATFKAGRLLREGLCVTLAGRPNVGKSSLFNAILGTERAIVTEIAGTTRDQINESFVVHGVPVVLTDTAGLRETADTVESIGVERTRRAVADADLVVVVLDASEPLSPEDIEVLEAVKGLTIVVAINKIDKAAVGREMMEQIRGSAPSREVEIIPVSARTARGLEELKHAIVHPFVSHETSGSGFLVTDARHHDLLARSRDEILSSIGLLDQHASEEITLIGLDNALRYLGQITGETTTEDMLTRIFSTFCIGK